jgi:archaellum component FlaC
LERNSLTALDFVINVLREHERDLTSLSDRLDETLQSVSGKGVKKRLGEINGSIERLAGEVKELKEKLVASEVIAVSTKEIVRSLEKQAAMQRQNIERLSGVLREVPNRREIVELQTRIVTLADLLQVAVKHRLC